MAKYGLILGVGKKADRNIYMLRHLKPELTLIQVNYSKRSSLIPEENFLKLSSELDEIQQIRDFMGKNKIEMVVNRIDTYIPLHGKIVDAFDLVGPGSSSVSVFRYKSEMHKLMVENGLGQFRPQAQILKFNQVAKKLVEFNYPVIVKPYVGHKSKGVFTLHSPDDWKEAQQRLEKHFLVGSIARMIDEPVVLVEQVVDGKMIAPVCYVDHVGKLHTLVILDVVRGKDIGQNNMQLVYRTTQSTLTKKQQQKVHWLLQELVTLSGLKSTFLDPELFVNDDQVFLIEINVRLGGLRAPLLKGAFGIDLNRLVVELAAGKVLDTSFIKDHTCTAVELWDNKSGMITGFQLPDVRSLIAYSQSFYEGDVYIAPPFSNKPLATFYVPDAADSYHKADQIRNEFKVAIT